jgi:hypothetical protein
MAINSDVLAEMEIPEVYLSVLASYEVLLASQIRRARFRSTSWCCMLLIAYIMCKIKMIFLVSDKDN